MEAGGLPWAISWGRAGPSRETLALPDGLGTKADRLVTAILPAWPRWASHLIGLAPTRGVQMCQVIAGRLVAAARDTRATRRSRCCQLAAADLALLAAVDAASSPLRRRWLRLLAASPCAP